MALPALLALVCLPSAFAAKLLASHYTGDIFTLDLSDSNTLSITTTTPSGATMPSWLEWSPDYRTVYVTDESWFGSGVLASFEVSEAGALTDAGKTATQGGDLYAGLFGTYDGDRFIAVANYEGSSISTYPLPLASDVQPVQTLTFNMSSPGPVPDRQDAPHPHSVFPSLTAQHLVVPDLGADLLRIFAVESPSGELRECPAAEAAPGDGPRHGEFARFGGVEVLYTVNELGNSVSAWNSTLDNTTPPAGSKAAEVHVKDNMVYIANRADQSFGAEHDSLAVFTADESTGELTFAELVDAHAYYPRTFAVNAAGDRIAVAGQTSANVAILERDVETGMVGGLLASVDVGPKGTAGNEDGLSAVIWV